MVLLAVSTPTIYARQAPDAGVSQSYCAWSQFARWGITGDTGYGIDGMGARGGVFAAPENRIGQSYEYEAIPDW